MRNNVLVVTAIFLIGCSSSTTPPINGDADENNPCKPDSCTEENKNQCVFDGSSMSCECNPDTYVWDDGSCHTQIPCSTGQHYGGDGITCTTDMCDPNPCQPPETCYNLGTQAYCACEEDCMPNPCDPNPCQSPQELCVQLEAAYSCVCNEEDGWHLNGAGDACTDDPCDPQTIVCGDRMHCIGVSGVATCVCDTDWSGDSCNIPALYGRLIRQPLDGTSYSAGSVAPLLRVQIIADLDDITFKEIYFYLEAGTRADFLHSNLDALLYVEGQSLVCEGVTLGATVNTVRVKFFPDGNNDWVWEYGDLYDLIFSLTTPLSVSQGETVTCDVIINTVDAPPTIPFYLKMGLVVTGAFKRTGEGVYMDLQDNYNLPAIGFY